LKTGSKVAVVGPHVFSTRDLLEDYMGDQRCADNTDNCIPTISEWIRLVNGADTTFVAQGV